LLIGKDFTEVLPSPFDQKYMRDLFDYGYQKALHGIQLVAGFDRSRRRSL
jgi:hypothetical protein